VSHAATISSDAAAGAPESDDLLGRGITDPRSLPTSPLLRITLKLPEFNAPLNLAP
jgi:hypothetical protein